ncbi:MAG: flippase [Bacteroidales bacterium]|nr:flippase [Bacteroidales bacterium]
MITKLKTLYAKLDVHTAEVVRKSAASTVVKVAGMIIGLGVSIFLGRTLGADGLGIINLSTRIVQILLIVGLFGMRQVIVKEIAIAHNNKDWKHIGNVMHTAYLLNGGITLIISLLMILASPWLAEHVFNEPRLTWPLVIAIMAMTPQVFSRIFSSGLVGYRKIWQSNLVDQALNLGVTGLMLLLIWFLGFSITVNRAAFSYAIGRIVVSISIGIYWHLLFHQKNKRFFVGKKLLITALPLFLVTLTFVISSNAGVIMLGWLGDAKMVGLFTVAARIALLTSFFLQVTNAAVSPKIASLYAEGKIREMERMVQSVTSGLLLIAILALIFFVFFGTNILSLWGAEFSEAYLILVIFSVGQFFIVGTGASGFLLMMCGLEKTYAKISIASVILNLVLNFIFIKNLGALGAAIATSITVAGESFIRVIVVKTKLKVWSIPIILMK